VLIDGVSYVLDPSLEVELDTRLREAEVDLADWAERVQAELGDGPEALQIRLEVGALLRLAYGAGYSDRDRGKLLGR
jgi:hypothetical protein